MNHLSAISKKTAGLLAILSLLITMSCNQKEQTAPPPPEIPVVLVKEQTVPIYQDFVGQIFGLKDIDIRARVEGFLLGVHFQEGARVTKGQLLYSIDPQPFQAKVAAQMSYVAEAKTMLAKAESDLARVRPLAEMNAVSKSDLDAAVANYEASVSSLEAANANLESAKIELGYTKILSPITGTIGKTQAKVGDFVGRYPNPVVLNTVSDIETVLVEFFLSENEYLRLSRRAFLNREEGGDKPQIKTEPNLDLILSDGSTHNHKGILNFVDREVNPTTGSILIQASFPNPEMILRPGQFARVRAKIDEFENARIVPQSTVMEIQGLFNVFMVGDSSKVILRQVEVGPTFNDFRVIKSGVEVNDKVVLEGLQKVRGGMVVNPKITEYQSKVKTN
ncbi:MAG: efflux RND transporter periplasmic adaptor subunit [Bacteroidales bacterium]|nr:efflux RND transporter periplasmic adaptor subunit [Bacteroidales bacterium]